MTNWRQISALARRSAQKWLDQHRRGLIQLRQNNFRLLLNNMAVIP
jgi:hypothetical protein